MSPESDEFETDDQNKKPDDEGPGEDWNLEKASEAEKRVWAFIDIVEQDLVPKYPEIKVRCAQALDPDPGWGKEILQDLDDGTLPSEFEYLRSRAQRALRIAVATVDLGANDRERLKGFIRECDSLAVEQKATFNSKHTYEIKDRHRDLLHTRRVLGLSTEIDFQDVPHWVVTRAYTFYSELP